MTDIARTTVILDVIADSRRSLTLTDLASKTGLPRSSVHRIVQALEKELYVARLADRPGYTLGPGLLKFGLNAHLRLLGANRTPLMTLSRAVNENAELAILSGRKAVVIDQVTVANQTKTVTATGKNFSMHATGVGKALLSQLPDHQVSEFLHEPLARFTPNTVSQSCEIQRELDLIKATNIAFELEEHQFGTCTIATATNAPIGGLQAVSVVIPARRIRQKFGLAIEALHRINPRVDVVAAKREFLTR